MVMAAARLGRVASVALAAAAVWATGLIVAGFLVPMYRSKSESSSREASYGTDTLVGVNGADVVLVLAVPLVLTLAVALALLLRSHRGALAAGWVVTAILAALNVLAMASIGLFVLPVTAALAVACAESSRSEPQIKA